MKTLSLKANTGDLVGKLEVDMLSNSPANITIMQIKDATGKIVDYLPAISGFNQRLAYSWAAFVSFCTAQNLRIDAEDSNGTNATNLLLNQKPGGTTYNIVSANSGTKTILIATDVHASFLSGDAIVIYNSDNTVFGSFTVNANSTYSAPNTSVVVTEAITAIGTSSGKYIKNNGQ
jgi:hypothetical protein